MSDAELKALWPEAPRWAPNMARPAYRYVRGVHPHPTRDAGGHSVDTAEPDAPDLPAERWRENTLYLYGVDLYHEGYLWEAHEAWEALWAAAGRMGPEADFFQGLILNAAAQLKAHEGNARGTRQQSRKASARMESALAGGITEDGVYMGLELRDWLGQMERHYGTLWADDDAGVEALEEPAPRLLLGES